MIDQEKLVELIKSAKEAMRGKEFTCNLEREYFTAEYLIAHGATVREMQKPLTVDETFNSRWSDPNLWIELREKETLFLMHGGTFTSESYGKIWRCWAEKPTEEERKAAEWYD